MAANRTTFEKLQRDRAKKAKAAAKREKRLARSQGELAEPEAGETPEIDVASTEPLSAEELLTLVEKVHADYDRGDLTFDEFEEKKLELMERLTVE